MAQYSQEFATGVAVITGAGSGIGEGIARCAAEAGMRVVVADIAIDRAESVAAAIRDGGGDARASEVDVAQPESLDALARFSYDIYGEVTLLVNNAGIETVGFSWELGAEAWERVLDINIHGAVHGVRAFAPKMIAAGKPAWIANTSSIGGFGITPLQTSYIMSKHAMIAYSECLFLEMEIKQAPVQVSVILPGPVKTRIFEDGQTESDATSAAHRDVMMGMLQANGISAYEAAQRILPQIAAGDFWVSTHPEMTAEFAGNRAAQLSVLAKPSLPQEVLANMGMADAL